MSKMSVEELVAKAKARVAELQAEKQLALKTQQTAITKAMTSMSVPALHTKGWAIDNSVQWNEDQLAAIDAGLAGKSFCLIGAAGTGKTTTLKGVVNSLLKNGLLPPIPQSGGTKYLHPGKPGIVLCSFTNMAVRQIAKHFGKDITCVTIHKLLEFAPVKYEITNELGEPVVTMRFEPSRNRANPLPRELTTIVVDESSMVDCNLIDLLIAALPNPGAVRWIFLGDLNQLPPVYGGPILGRKLLELPIVELRTVYRQALLSPIIQIATAMKDGKPWPVSGTKTEINSDGHGKVIIYPWSKSVSWEDAALKMSGFLKAAIRDGYLDVFQDMVLCPFKVKFGVVELNAQIADYLGRQRGAVVHEIVAGRETKYLAIGDKLLIQKQECIITHIAKNHRYLGKRPINAELYDIDRWGAASKRETTVTPSEEFALEHDFDVDELLTQMVTTEIVDKVNAASHVVQYVTLEQWQEWQAEGLDPAAEAAKQTSPLSLSTAAELNETLFGYALTVHKSQGSEWRKVFFITHQSHAAMCSRELMYTGITRARDELFLIVEPDRGMKAGTLTSSTKKPRLKGNTLAEKLISLKERFAAEAAEAQKSSVKPTLKEEDDE